MEWYGIYLIIGFTSSFSFICGCFACLYYQQRQQRFRDQLSRMRQEQSYQPGQEIEYEESDSDSDSETV